MKTGVIDEEARAKGLPEARERLRVASLPKQERKDYERHMDALAYQRSVISTGFIEGHADGFAEGKAEGREEGRAEGREEGKIEGLAQGREEGLAEGNANAKRKIAKQMKSDGLPVDVIARYTGLNSEEIENL